MDLMNLSL